ncbi:hypothetical protein NA57DRAFT_71189 [Rhizodiscina lignyota]|uniref:CENP-V/GFA domain-containing protein n=1 Tax=Rhizodiscina lignyota TaxID=1504668 RepID=A0A9P4MH21_9PEZI|nr:hypothetical protein NA57DRAFT_71189 [Rhizodiscina lignyota]
MATTHKGSCSCEAIKIEVQADPAFIGLCHCRNCQKSTGSTYSTNWVVPRSAFKIVSGEPTTYKVTGGSGNPALRQFCGTCSSTMWTETSMRPDIIVIKVGVMDDGGLAKFTPGIETFTSRKPGWVKEVEGATQFEESFPIQPQQ